MIKNATGTKSVPKSSIKNRKMRLYFVLDSQNGIKRVGCRASGCHKGHFIERTAWCDYKDYPDMINELEILATGRYNAEVREIDRHG
ncbi:hypothetical protein EEL53_10295 [Muribaculaceae bacterium Isolate-114 (HZI)]|nr:hypothetical protein EEL53_10295 [Muribaculaceae bacterium Isolate-114 (HZI)]